MCVFFYDAGLETHEAGSSSNTRTDTQHETMHTHAAHDDRTLQPSVHERKLRMLAISRVELCCRRFIAPHQHSQPVSHRPCAFAPQEKSSMVCWCARLNGHGRVRRLREWATSSETIQFRTMWLRHGQFSPVPLATGPHAHPAILHLFQSS